MQKEPITIRASKSQFHWYLALGLFSSIVCVWLGYQVIHRGSSWDNLFIGMGFALFGLAVAVARQTTVVVIKNGQLTISSHYFKQRVQLDDLIRAERYRPGIGKVRDEVLRLDDSRGDSAHVTPAHFRVKDAERLMAILHPYVFRAKVDKNFMDLQFFIDQGLDLPKPGIKQIIRGTFLYVLLPCLILTALLIFWAIITEQPAFR